MDKSEIEQLLSRLDEAMGSPCDLLIVGGAAMILHFGATRATRDIDVLVLEGEPSELRRAALEVARSHGVPENWISDAVKGFADVLLPDFSARLVRLELPLHRLNIYALGRPDQVAMKIVALREQDLEDLDLLGTEITADDVAVLLRIKNTLARRRPDWAQKIGYFLEEQGWT